MTSAKEEVIAESRSDGQKIAFELGRIATEMNTESEERSRDKLQKVVLAVEDVRLFVARQRKLVPDDPRVEKALTLKSMLLQAGMQEPGIAPGGRRKRYRVNLGSLGGKDYVLTYVVTNFEVAANAPWGELEPYLKRVEQDLWAM